MATITGSKRLLSISADGMAANTTLTLGGLDVATKSYVTTQITNLVDSAPTTLDTLNELAAALGDDPNFATTVTNSIAAKLDASVNPIKNATVANDTITFTRADNTTFNITTSDANTNYYLTGLSFDTSDGVLTATVNGASNPTVDLDGRYSLTSHSHNIWDLPFTRSGINIDTAGNNNIWDYIHSTGTADGTYPTTYMHVVSFGDESHGLQLGSPYSSNTNLYYRQGTDNGASENGANVYKDWKKIWSERDFSSTNISNWNTAHGWGNHASAGYLTSASAAATYQPIGNYFTDGDTVLNMANNDGLSYNDTNNLMYVIADGVDYPIIDERGGTITGTLTLSGGGTKISMNNGDIVGVNQILINDPGEGIVWTSGASGNMTLAITDDASDSILNLSGTGASLAVNGAKVATQSWVTGQNYITNNYYLDGLSFATGTGVLTASVNGTTNQTIDLDGRYAYYDHFRSLGVPAFTGGSNPNITTAQLVSEMEADGAFDSYTSAFKTSWSYAGNYDLSDAGNFTETAGTSWLTWTDNSSDSTRGNITALAIAPNTGGSAGRVFIYNDQGSSYSPGWREVWTNTSLDPIINATVSNDSITFTKANGGTFTLTTSDANTNYYLDGLSFDVATGELTASVNGTTNQAVDLDGRYQLSGTYNTVIGTDTDLDTTGAEVVDQINVTDGVIQSMSKRTMTLANLGYTGATNADSYGSWRISDGNNTDSIASGETVNITGAGATTVTYDPTTNILEISSTDTNTNTNYYLTGLSYTSSSSVLTATVNGASNPTLDLTNKIYADALAVTGNGTTSQYLRSDGDGTFTWATPPDTNTDTNYYLSGLSYTSSSSVLTATVTGGTDQTLDLTNKIYADALAVSGNGTNGQFLRSDGDGTFTWATPTDTDTNTTYTLTVGAGTSNAANINLNPSTGGTNTVKISGGTNVQVTESTSTGVITISATDTNTTYSAGAGLVLNGTSFEIDYSNAATAIMGSNVPSGTASGSTQLLLKDTGGSFIQSLSAIGLSLFNNDIGAGGGGTITGVRLNGNSGYAQVTSGVAAIDVVGGTGISTTGSGTTLTITNTVTDTTYSAGSGLQLSGTTFSVNVVDGTTQTTAANARTTTSGRTYAIQFDSTGNLVVNVPWVDTNTNTTYTADGNYGMTLSGTAFRLENDRRRNSSTTDIYTGNTHDYTFYDASHGIRWYTAGSQEMFLTDAGVLHVDSDIIAYSSTISDQSFKDDVVTIDNAIDKVKKLRGVEYTWNSGSRKGKRDLGLIAQEVEEVLPEIVHEHEMPLMEDAEAGKTYKTVDYEKMVGVLIEAVKEQQTQIDSLKAQVEQLKSK